jgi:hypothetical protein
LSVRARRSCLVLPDPDNAQECVGPRNSPTRAPCRHTASPSRATLTTHDFDRLRARIDAILARHHGYLAQLTVNAREASGRSLNANLGIPAGQLDSALAGF